jgi:hypothetical protein
VFALRDRSFAKESLGSFELAARIRGAILGHADLGFRSLHFRGIGGWIYGDEQLALADKVAFSEVDALNRAGDARSNIDAFDRLDAARELIPGSDFALLDDGDGNRYRGRHYRNRSRRRAGSQLEKRCGGEAQSRAHGAEHPILSATCPCDWWRHLGSLDKSA